MTEHEKDLQREAETKERLSQFVRGRLLARELGVEILWMNFVTGESLIKFVPENAARVASMAGVG